MIKMQKRQKLSTSSLNSIWTFSIRKEKRDMFLNVQQTLLRNIAVFKVDYKYKMMKIHLRISKWIKIERTYLKLLSS